MRFTPGKQSDDVIDRRGKGEGAAAGMGGLLRLVPLLLRMRYGWVLLLVGGVVVFLRGGLSSLPFVGTPSELAYSGPRGRDQAAEFVGFVLDDVQKTWDAELGWSMPYRHAKLVLFTDRTSTACGLGEAATGPFYCPADERVYIDLGFFDALSRKFGAKGDFAQAYVIAHEIGHHVQHVVGASTRVHAAPRAERDGPTGLSVRLELQADCLAGVWAHFTGRRSLLEQGDLEEALAAAGAIGDDRLQKRARGTVNPESFTHGTSEQRARWFRRGFEQGNRSACDAFAAAAL